MIVLIGGGVRSGKSGFALRLARKLGQRRHFVATAEPRDLEMANRIRRHRLERGEEFQTMEVPIEIGKELENLRGTDVVVVDCLTIWMSNLLLRGDPEDSILARVDGLVSMLRAKPFHSILITNEVGMGIVPESALGRAFRDLCGRAHQAIAAGADEIYFGALGTLLRLKPGPVSLMEA